MRTVLWLALVALIALLVWPGEASGSWSDVIRSFRELAHAVEAVFRWYATFDHALHMQLWSVMSGRSRALLGALRCLSLLLTLWGLVALRGVRRVLRRVL